MDQMRACMVLPLISFGYANLILICTHFLLFANGSLVGIVSGDVVTYSGIKKNSVDGPGCGCAIVASFLLSFRKLI